MSHNFELLNAQENLNELNDAYEESGEDQICRFFSTDAFNEEFSLITDKDLSVVHCNIRSLNSNGDDFVNFLSTLSVKFDVICLTETWIKDVEYLDSFFPSYNAFHSCRPGNNRGGGVSIFLGQGFQIRNLTDLNGQCHTIESIF